MRLIRLTCAAAAAAICAGTVPVLEAQQDPESVTVNWSDPSRPGTITMHAVVGDITIRGSNRKDVLVVSRATSRAPGTGRGRGGRAGRGGQAPAPAPGAATPTPAPTPEPGRADQLPSDVPPGFRRLTRSRGFTLEERNNEMSINSGLFMPNADFEIEVPARTNLRLTAMSGRIVVEGVEGDIEVNSMAGPVNLTNVAGAVVAQSMSDQVTAVLSRVAADKAMSFTSFNGNVDVTLPASVKANLKLRSTQGDVFTDFDIQTRATPSPAPTPATTQPSPGGRDRSGRERARREPAFRLDETIYGTINGGGPEIELRTYTGRVLLRRGK